jgi:hypothetical protein
VLDETAGGDAFAAEDLSPEQRIPAPGLHDTQASGALVDEAVRRFGNPVQEVRRSE